MNQASRKAQDRAKLTSRLLYSVREVVVILLFLVTLFLLLALLSYQPTDPSWSHSANVDQVQNHAGVIGAWIADVLFYLFGYLAYLFPMICLFSGWRILRQMRQQQGLDSLLFSVSAIGCLFGLIGGCALAWMYFRQGRGSLEHQSWESGGILGEAVGSLLQDGAGYTGSTLIALFMFIAGFTIYARFSWLGLMEVIGRGVLRGIAWCTVRRSMLRDTISGYRARRVREDTVKREQEEVALRPPPKIAARILEPETGVRLETEKQAPLFEVPTGVRLPPLGLLDVPGERQQAYSSEALEALSRQVEMKLKDFGLVVEVVAVCPGPVITRFELRLSAGTKVSKLTSLAKDLARSLSVNSVRIVEVIPGKAVVGLEIPNEERELVLLSEVLRSKAYESMQSPLVLGLGKDIGGQPVVTNLGKMPHLLVAGTTGAGKSVALNAMILSLLYKATAREVRLIMIDPKMLELSVYEGIPHLLAPVVTDMREAANALRWCVAEMERRYKLMSALGVRNIGGYNRRLEEDNGQPILDPLYTPCGGQDTAPALEALPFIVVIIDELADMMMIVGKKVEALIARLAQKARAAGIHLVLATQRPSVDVITGLIKANVPARIAFQVSSKIDSRTILDQMGAENLLGHGDMLFLPAGSGVPERIHGAFVSDDEVHKVVNNIRSGTQPDYDDSVLSSAGLEEAGEVGMDTLGVDDDQDALYDQAVRIVTETRRASISYVQRRLKIGYNRAARLVEQMEQGGVVGPLESNGNREVLAAPPPSAG